MSNDMQQMPCQILDLGLKCYLRTLDLQLYLYKIFFWFEYLMKSLDLSFHKRKRMNF